MLLTRILQKYDAWAFKNFDSYYLLKQKLRERSWQRKLRAGENSGSKKTFYHMARRIGARGFATTWWTSMADTLIGDLRHRG